MELSEVVSDGPVECQVLGLKFVLFRDTRGMAHCLSNICTHRGGALANGKLRKDCVECCYHGWQFNGEGECVKIPSIGNNGKVPPRTRTDAYPVQEKWGIIFAFLGDLPEAERPPIMEVKEEDQEGWMYTVQSWKVRCNFERSVENALDPAHNEFVHPTHGFSGDRDDYNVPEYEPIEQDWGTGFMTTFVSGGLPDEKMKHMKPGKSEMEAGSGHHGPNHIWTFIHFNDQHWMHQYLFEAPVDENNIIVFLVNYRNTMLDQSLDERIITRNYEVAEQDIAVLEALQPNLTPPNLTHEVMMPADRCIVRYREHLNDWDARGWRIDMDEFNRTKNKKAYAIPSPARRNRKGWVIDPVPLITPEGVKAKQAAE